MLFLLFICCIQAFLLLLLGRACELPPPPLSVDLCVRASSPPISVDLCVRARGLFQQLLSRVSDRRELFRLGLVHWCVRGQGPRCLRERFRTIGEVGHSGTRGSSNLFLPSVNTEFLRRSVTFRGAWDWNKLPVSVRELGSEVFRRRLKARILDRLQLFLTSVFVPIYLQLFYLCAVCLCVVYSCYRTPWRTSHLLAEGTSSCLKRKFN